jgi:hypothetical protein
MGSPAVSGGGLDVEFINPDRSFASWNASALTLSPKGRATVTGDGSFAGGNAILTARLTATGPPTPHSAGRATAASSSRAPATTGYDGRRRGLGGVLTLGVGSSFVQLLLDGHAQREVRPGGLTNIGAPAGRPQRGRAAPPGRQIATLARFVENVGNLYVSRWRLPRSRGRAEEASSLT